MIAIIQALVDFYTKMKCCKCGNYTTLDPKAPGSTSCSTCTHGECNNCDFS
ncbi:hypothetical protein NA56DRAFT_561300 [Hyaloscypha hepaticicola]|uniref:Uncharacterized protein n=1 Tax=Hyaloscypha hepaticicola TaxID=2082293 RepID=A0A2J6QMV2_9HELO|nr:hypothetical protein NA56DRAFT_561300 [Hyaloscypha hepaticicola]